MNKDIKMLILLVVILTAFGCGLKAYMGLHGKSIQKYPDVHESVVQDSKCLECHHPDNSAATPTPHPNFTGCLKCHNDDMQSDKM